MKQTSQEIQFGESRKSSNVSSLASNETTLTECKTRVIQSFTSKLSSVSPNSLSSNENPRDSLIRLWASANQLNLVLDKSGQLFLLLKKNFISTRVKLVCLLEPRPRTVAGST